MSKLQVLNSVSGGKSSAYIYANYPSQLNIFSLVTIENRDFLWMQGKDEKTRQLISDKIGYEFIGTAEMDPIIYTVLDLEQKFGYPIITIAGMTFEALIRDRKGFLPSHSRRFCTTRLKIEPIFDYLYSNNLLPVNTALGFRKGEETRKAKSMTRLSPDGYEYMLHRTTQKPNSRYFNRANTKYRKLSFPLIDNSIDEGIIEQFWSNNSIRFAAFNNCVGCVNRSPLFLSHLSKSHSYEYSKFVYLENYANDIAQSHGKSFNVTFRPEGNLASIANPKIDFGLFDSDFNDCDSGYCGL